MPQKRARHTRQPVRTGVLDLYGQDLPTTVIVRLLESYGFALRSRTPVYPDLTPATILTFRKRTPAGKAEVVLFIRANGSCKVTITHSHFRDAAAVGKVLKQL